jgi:phosphoglycolate phosphatase
MTPRTALVDLDGTLTDPADGIIGGVQFALRQLGADVPEWSALTWVIGPPLSKSFPELLPDPTPARVSAAVEAYRSYYRETGIYQAAVYAGAPEALEQLRTAGFTLLVCTVKPHVFATPVVEHFGLARYFDGVYGAELDGRFEDKGELMEHIVVERQLAAVDMVMIGDRGLDMLAARRNAITGIGVTWGYGTADELRDAGAERLCHAPGEMPAAAEAILRG